MVIKCSVSLFILRLAYLVAFEACNKHSIIIQFLIACPVCLLNSRCNLFIVFFFVILVNVSCFFNQLCICNLLLIITLAHLANDEKQRETFVTSYVFLIIHRNFPMSNYKLHTSTIVHLNLSRLYQIFFSFSFLVEI